VVPYLSEGPHQRAARLSAPFGVDANVLLQTTLIADALYCKRCIMAKRNYRRPTPDYYSPYVVGHRMQETGPAGRCRLRLRW